MHSYKRKMSRTAVGLSRPSTPRRPDRAGRRPISREEYLFLKFFHIRNQSSGPWAWMAGQARHDGVLASERVTRRRGRPSISAGAPRPRRRKSPAHALEQAGQHLAGAALHELVTPAPAMKATHSRASAPCRSPAPPADGGSLPDRPPVAAVTLATTGNAGLCDRRRRQRRLHGVGGRLHQRAMEGRGHRQQHGALDPLRLRELHGAIDRRRGA